MDFRFYDIRLDLPSSLSDEKKDGVKSSTEMTVAELSAKLRSRGVAQEALRELEIEFNKKLTIPLSCLVFALVGLPLGIRAHRSVRARGFTIGLAIVLLYYLMRLSGEALVETGRLSPVIGTWTPNVVFAIAGILLFIFSVREQRPWAFRRSCGPGNRPSPRLPREVRLQWRVPPSRSPGPIPRMPTECRLMGVSSNPDPSHRTMKASEGARIRHHEDPRSVPDR